MFFTQICLAEIARAGVGGVYLLSALLDLKARGEIFDLMAKKRVPMPMICYIGAITWKIITSMGLIFNFYVYAAALLLSLYIFLANLVFNNFWAAPAKQRNFSQSMFLTHLAVSIGLLAIAATT